MANEGAFAAVNKEKIWAQLGQCPHFLIINQLFLVHLCWIENLLEYASANISEFQYANLVGFS